MQSFVDAWLARWMAKPDDELLVELDRMVFSKLTPARRLKLYGHLERWVKADTDNAMAQLRGVMHEMR